MIQQAIHQVLEPLFEPKFSASSYGFRPKRGAHQALKAASEYVKSGKAWVVDIDLAKFFDKISHDWLRDNIPMDKEILSKWLSAGYINQGVFHQTEFGTPQGGLCNALHKPPYAKKNIMQSNWMRAFKNMDLTFFYSA